MATDDTTIDESLSVRGENLLDTVLVYVTTAIFLLIIVLATVQVLVRQLPIQIEILFWTEPLARYLLIMMTFLGTAVAVRNDENVKIDLLQRRLQHTRPRLYHAVTIAISLCLLVFVYIAIRGAITSAQDSWMSGTNLPILTYGMIHAVIAISVGLMGIYTLYELVPYLKLLVAKLTEYEYEVEERTETENEYGAVNQQPSEDDVSTRAQKIMGFDDADESDDTNKSGGRAHEQKTDELDSEGQR